MHGSNSIRIEAIAALAVLVAGVPGCAHRMDLDSSRTFQEAQTVFDQAESPEDFLRAAGLYQQILDSGVVSGALLYNQGNAFMQAGQRGRAIAAYRKALRYRPRDPLLQANLEYARAGDRPAARRPVIETLLFWQDWLSYPEKFYAAAAAALVAFGLGVAALFAGRRLLWASTLASAVVTLLFVFSAGYDWYRYDHTLHGVVVVPEAVARKGNAVGYEPAFTEPLGEGAEFRVVERRGDWLLIHMPGGLEGWLEADSVTLY